MTASTDDELEQYWQDLNLADRLHDVRDPGGDTLRRLGWLKDTADTGDLGPDAAAAWWRLLGELDDRKVYYLVALFRWLRFGLGLTCEQSRQALGGDSLASRQAFHAMWKRYTTTKPEARRIVTRGGRGGGWPKGRKRSDG